MNPETNNIHPVTEYCVILQGGSSGKQQQQQRGEHDNVAVRRGDSWLAGGRDLHWETMTLRPKSAHIPGWMEGMPPRPRSTAAARALK